MEDSGQSKNILIMAKIIQERFGGSRKNLEDRKRLLEETGFF